MDFTRIKDTYDLLEEREIKDLRSKGIRLKHKKTGARVMLLENDDKNTRAITRITIAILFFILASSQ